MRAAGLHPIVKALASGSHYAGKGEVPLVPGVDGVGTLEDGSRVFFEALLEGRGESMCEQNRGSAFEVPAGCQTTSMTFRQQPSPIPACLRGFRSRIGPGSTERRDGSNSWSDRGGGPACDPGGAACSGRNESLPRAQSRCARFGESGRYRFACAGGRCNPRSICGRGSKGNRRGDRLSLGTPDGVAAGGAGQGFQSGRARASTRLVEVGQSAGPAITLAGRHAAQHRPEADGTADLALCRLERVCSRPFQRLFSMAAAGSLRVAAEPVPLAEVEARGTSKDERASGSFLRPKSSKMHDLRREFAVTGNTLGGVPVSKTIGVRGNLWSFAPCAPVVRWHPTSLGKVGNVCRSRTAPGDGTDDLQMPSVALMR